MISFFGVVDLWLASVDKLLPQVKDFVRFDKLLCIFFAFFDKAIVLTILGFV